MAVAQGKRRKRQVKKLIGGLVLVIVLVLTMTGCSVDKQFADRMAAPASLLFPDMKKVYRGEPLNLDQEQRLRRLRLLEEWERTILEAEKASK